LALFSFQVPKKESLLDFDEWIGADDEYRGLERIHPKIFPFVQLSNQPELSNEKKRIQQRVGITSSHCRECYLSNQEMEVL
jgi:hypothetical protein